MKIRKNSVIFLFLVFFLILLFSQNLISLVQDQEKKDQRPKIIIIPDEVKKVFEEGMQTRQTRSDIPFAIVKQLYFPAGSNLYTIFIFRVKNADLGFSPIAGSPEEKKEKEETLSAAETPSPQLQSKSHLFLQLNELENGAPGEVAYEVYVPVNIQEESSTFEPEKVDYYSTGYPLAPGNYLLSMAVCSQKLEKIGTQYLEVSLPDVSSLGDKLETTPLFFVRRQEFMDSPERRPTAHKGLFTYSILKIEPQFENIFSSGDNLELLYYIFGAQPTENGTFNIEVSYSILKDEEKAVSFAPGNYDTPFVNQPLPLKKTVVIKSESGERTEEQEIEAGKYTLSLEIVDKVSGKSITLSVGFEVQ